jgi:surface antigen
MATVFWNRNIADEAHQKMKEFIADGQDITWIAFAPPGGNRWSVVTNQTFFNRNIPDECHQKMKDFVDAGQQNPVRRVPPARR